MTESDTALRKNRGMVMATDNPAAQPLQIKGYEELPLERIADYPGLAQCHAAWRAAQVGGKLPATIAVEALPKDVLPYVMLLDYEPERRDVRVRLAGNFVGERTSGEEGGRRLRNFFSAQDAEIVFRSLEHVAALARPSLAKRDYVTLEGRPVRYVRLILPLSLDGKTVTGFFKTIEPATLEAMPG